jgi:hypothetical protein
MDPQALVRPDNTLYRKASEISSEMPLETSKLDIHGLFLSRLIFFCQSNPGGQILPRNQASRQKSAVSGGEIAVTPLGSECLIT